MAALLRFERDYVDTLVREAARRALYRFMHYTRPADKIPDSDDLEACADIFLYIRTSLSGFFRKDKVLELEPTVSDPKHSVRRWEIVLVGKCMKAKTTSPVCFIAITAYGKESGKVIYIAASRPLHEDTIVAASDCPPFYSIGFRQGRDKRLRSILPSDLGGRTVALADLRGCADRAFALLGKAKSFAAEIEPIECAADALFQVLLNELDGFLSLSAVLHEVAALAHLVQELGGAFKVGPENADDTVPFACGTKDFLEACMQQMGPAFGICDQATEISQEATDKNIDTSA